MMLTVIWNNKDGLLEKACGIARFVCTYIEDQPYMELTHKQISISHVNFVKHKRQLKFAFHKKIK